MTDWHYLRVRLLKERGPLCECGCGQEWTDCHHAIIGRMKDRPYLDCVENLQVLNHSCHLSSGHGYKEKAKFWQVQCARYGVAHMQAWLDRLPLKIKPRFGD